MFYVYKITNLINDKVYIGKTNNPSERWSDHKKIAKAGSINKSFSVVHSAIRKYGEDNFEFLILEKIEHENLAFDRESYWISEYKSNIQKYGDQFGYNLTDGGEGWSGRKHTEFSKMKMSEYKKAHPNSPEANRKISQANKGKILSKKHREKLSDAGCGESNSNSKLTAEQVSEIKRLLQEGNKGSELAKLFNISQGTIHYIKTGKRWA